jgi:hypothetical protein
LIARNQPRVEFIGVDRDGQDAALLALEPDPELDPQPAIPSSTAITAAEVNERRAMARDSPVAAA